MDYSIGGKGDCGKGGGGQEGQCERELKPSMLRLIRNAAALAAFEDGPLVWESTPKLQGVCCKPNHQPSGDLEPTLGGASFSARCTEPTCCQSACELSVLARALPLRPPTEQKGRERKSTEQGMVKVKPGASPLDGKPRRTKHFDSESSDVWRVYLFFASQSHHKYIYKKFFFR